jgi:ATP-dependent helicase/nuclease subunit A
VLFAGRRLAADAPRQADRGRGGWLKAASERNTNSGVFEALCVYYVAMTRAKRELVVLLKPAADCPSESCFFSDHVDAALGVPLPWSAGDPGWLDRAGLSAPTAGMPPRLLAPPPRPKRRLVRRVTPSSSIGFGRAASELFSPRDSHALQRGTRLHEALSQVEWLDPAAPQPAGIATSELDLTLCSALRDALTRAPHVIDLWRERPFELVADNQWISGTFDRVVFFEKDGERWAEIVDFKSNRRRGNESEAAFALRMQETYAEQMSSYRQALSRLSGIPERAIRCTLLLTDTRQAVQVNGLPGCQGTRAPHSRAHTGA